MSTLRRRPPKQFINSGFILGFSSVVLLVLLVISSNAPQAQPEFNVGDKVYFAADKELKGIVDSVNCTSHRNYCTYRVVFSPRVGRYAIDAKWLGAHMIVKEHREY